METAIWMDGQTEEADCITPPGNVIGKYFLTGLLCVVANALQWYSFRTRLVSEDLAAKFVQFSDDEETKEFLENSKEKSDQLFTQLFHSTVKCILSWTMTRTSINGYIVRTFF